MHLLLARQLPACLHFGGLASIYIKWISQSRVKVIFEGDLQRDWIITMSVPESRDGQYRLHNGYWEEVGLLQKLATAHIIMYAYINHLEFMARNGILYTKRHATPIQLSNSGKAYVPTRTNFFVSVTAGRKENHSWFGVPLLNDRCIRSTLSPGLLPGRSLEYLKRTYSGQYCIFYVASYCITIFLWL